MPASNSPMIAVRVLTKSIGEQEILRGIDLEVATGETLVIIGRSGGGKSVLLKHLIGLMLPDAGEIWIEGQNIIGLSERKLAPIRRKVGILFQGAALFDSMTVEENIAFPLREAGERDETVIREKVNEMLEVIEMEGQQTKMPVNLSGGMKKRVGLARSIIRRPSCVLIRRTDRRPRPGRFRQHQSTDPAAAGTFARHQRGGDARHEERLSHRGSHRLLARGTNIFLRHARGTRTLD